MKRRGIITVSFFLLLAVCLFWFLSLKPEDSSTAAANLPASRPSAAVDQASPKAEPERFKEASALVESIFSAPIEFYGRVIDQNGDPVPYANIGYTAADKFNASGSNYTGQADEKGNFQIIGIKGAGLAVTVRKEGYYLIHNPGDRSLPTSTATFAYGMGPDSYRRPAPTKEKPAVFVLQKMGETTPLYRAELSARVLKDGTPVAVDLRTGHLSPNGNIRIEAWTEAPTQGRKFNWRCRITVPDGGIVERAGRFQFEAPKDGYRRSVELGMPHDSNNWASEEEREFFVKLPDERYALVKFRMIAGGNHYFVLESFLNPSAGDRNLEFDPDKVIKSP